MKLVYASLTAAPFLAQTVLGATSTTYNTIKATAPTTITGTDIKTSADSVASADSQLAAGIITTLNGISQNDLNTCDSTNNINRPGLTQGAIDTLISDLNFDYAMGLVLQSEYDTVVANLKTCATTNSATTADADTLDNMRGQISSYANKPGFNFAQLATDVTNPASLGAAQLSATEFTPAMQKSYYKNMQVWAASLMSSRYPSSTVTGVFAFGGTTWANIDTVTTTFADLAAFEAYLVKQLKLKALGQTSTFDSVHTNRVALADDWFTDGAVTQAQKDEFTNLIANRKTAFDTLSGTLTTAETAYNDKSQFSALYETILTDNASLYSTDPSDAKTSFDSIATALTNSNFVNADTWLIGMDADSTCLNAMNAKLKYTESFGGSAEMTMSQKLHNLYMLHAFRYIDATQLDAELDAFDDCIDASSLTATEKTNYKAGLRSADSGLTLLSTAKIDIDFERQTDYTNDADSDTKVSLSAAQDNEWFIADLLRITDKVQTFADLFDGGASTISFTTPPTNLNTFNTQTKLQEEMIKQAREYAIDGVSDVTSTWEAQIYDQRSALADSFGLTGTPKTTFESAMVTMKTNLDNLKAQYLTSKNAYDVVTTSYTPMAMSTTINSVYTANSAKFTDDTNAVASYTSITAAITAAAPAIDYISSLAGTDLTTCTTALHTAYGLDVAHTYSAMADEFFMYAFRYIRADEIDLGIAANTACINAVAPSNAATLITGMTTGKNAIVQYSGKIEFDWTIYTNAVNVPSTYDVVLTTAEKMKLYHALDISYSDAAALTAANDLSTATQTQLSTQLALAASLTNINALFTSDSTYNTITDWSNFGNQERREYAVGQSNDWESQFVNAKSDIADALALTGTDKTTYEASFTQTKSLIDAWKARVDLMEANYNSGERLGFGLVIAVAAFMKMVFE